MKVIREDGILYNIRERRAVHIVPDVSLGHFIKTIFVGWQPGRKKLNISKGGFEWIFIEQNGSPYPDSKVLTINHCRHNIMHCKFVRSGNHFTMLILDMVSEKTQKKP